MSEPLNRKLPAALTRAIKLLGSVWIYSGLLLIGLGLLSLLWQPPAFDTIMLALVSVCVLAGLGALLLSYPPVSIARDEVPPLWGDSPGRPGDIRGRTLWRVLVPVTELLG